MYKRTCMLCTCDAIACLKCIQQKVLLNCKQKTLFFITDTEGTSWQLLSLCARSVIRLSTEKWLRGC